jgi:hypothetical protein
MNERRITPRKRSFLKGTVYFNNRMSSIDCVVRDFSDGGARLEFTTIVTLPDSIELYIPTRDQTLQAQVRWRKDTEVGIGFDIGNSPTERSSASGDLEQRVKQLEQDVTKLQRTILDLRSDLRHTRGED